MDAQPFSRKLADMVTGDHNLTAFDGHPHADLVRHEAVASLATLIRATYSGDQSCGWYEHTNDWDWYVGITLRDGTKMGDEIHRDVEDDIYCDSFTVNPPIDGGRPPVDTIPPRELTLELWAQGSGEITTAVVVPLADIALITVAQR